MFTDSEKAYDCVSREEVWRCMRKGGSGKLCKNCARHVRGEQELKCKAVLG